jgi:single-strand DNA-binding protein
MNNLAIIGRLTKDYEVRFLPSGKSIGEFTLAVNDGWGENEHTSYFDVTVFGKSVERHSDYIKKGSLIGVTGSIRQERWESKDGQKRSKVKVVANRIDYLDSKPKEETSEWD